MKLSWWVLFFFFLAGSSSCKWGTPKKPSPAIAKDTLVYSYQTIKKRAADCGNKPDSDCTLATIKYPVFKNAGLLNGLIMSKMTGATPTDKMNSINALVADFLKSYDDSKTDTSANIVAFTMDENVTVLRQDSNLTTLQIESYVFEGGAHGSNYTQFINWGTKANRNVLLSDILTPGYKESLIKIGEAIFRKDEKLSSSASLDEDYFFKRGRFSLPANFSITPLGIRFLYNEYEIKPYSAGQTDLLIPYAQIKSLLKPNTVVTQYLK